MIILIIIFVGMFGMMGWLFTCRYDHWYQRIIGFIVGALLGIGCLFAIKHQSDAEVERWDNGHCEECNGLLEFTGGSSWRTYHEYYYTCNECGHTETFEQVMK